MNVAIIGGGASGMACAISIMSRSKENGLKTRVTIFESKDRLGKKLLATGNGRCNLMNENECGYYFDVNGFSTYALKKFDVKSNLNFFRTLGLYTRTDEAGRIYPLSNQASSVLDALRFACEDLGVKVICDTEIRDVRKHQGCFFVNGEVFDKLVLACGGKAGVKNFNGYELLEKLGHKITRIEPSLTKLEVLDKRFTKQLKGVRQKGVFSLFESDKLIAREVGELLFTEYGLSGIAVMQLSAFVARSDKKNQLLIRADFVPELSHRQLSVAISDLTTLHPDYKTENLLSGFVAKKLGEAVIKKLNIELSVNISKLTEKQIASIVNSLKSFTFQISALRAFDDAQVTAGGADTAFFNPKTMQSKKINGLYCIGELLDVDGLCGGYNLNWAWSSGRLCAESIINEQLNRKG